MADHRRTCWIAAAIAFVLTGCDADRPVPRQHRLELGSADDVADILRANGVSPPPLHCANVAFRTGEVIRTVACTLELRDADVRRLVAAIPLERGSPFHADYVNSCETSAGLASTETGVQVLVGNNTKVTNGVERIELHVDRARRLACIEITYPWSG